MLKSLMFKTGLIALACSISLSAHALADTAQQIDVPPGDLTSALELISKQAGVELVFRPEQLKGLRTQGVSGLLTSQEAVRKLLEGTRLQLRTDPATGAMMIGAPASAGTPRTRSGSASPDSFSAATEGDDSTFRRSAAQGQPLSDRLRLAQAEASGTVGTGSHGTRTGNADSGSLAGSESRLEEVIVTAQKKDERLHDVPVPVTVVDTRQLEENNQTLLQDYYNTIPGLSIGPLGSQNDQLVVLRGISTGQGHDPTVGVTLDDAPFGGFTNAGIGNQLPDVDPNDLERIEVLRGPQGTLYGTLSMGGLIKYVPKDPTTDSLSGSATAGTSAVRNGARAGYNFRGSANIPLGSDLAVRASAYTRQDPGYIDSPVLGIDGINESRSSGGMLTVKWTPSESLSLKVRALYQQVNSDGSSDISGGLGDLQQSFAPGVGAGLYDSQFYSAVLNASLGSVQLTSVTGYSIFSLHASFDYTPVFNFAGAFYPGSVYAPWFGSQTSHSFSQEMRLSGSIGPALEWLAGAFYAYQKNENIGSFDAQSAAGAITGDLFSYDAHNNYREYAGFVTLTYHVTDRVAVQIGGRESHSETHSYETDDGALPALTGPTPVFKPQQPAANDVFTYLVTPQFRISPDLLLYARAATGYRPGGNNGQQPGATVSIPTQYKSDKTQNYEIGLKADALDHRLSIDTSLYYINWSDIQVNVNLPLFSYVANVGKAKSEGVELSVMARPLPGLTVSGWVDYDNAVLTEAAPANSIAGLPGDRLPYSSRWSGNVSVQQEFPMGNAVTGFVGAQVSLVGNRLGEFANCSVSTSPCPAPVVPRDYFPGYTQTNLRTGAKYGRWAANLFANNVTDKRGLLSGGNSAVPPGAFVIIQPRTIGLNISRSF